MGSGKGQSRRAQAVASKKAAHHVDYDENAWLEHLKQAGISKTTSEDYYLGTHKKNYDLFDEKTQEMIASEHFRDAIAVGVIKLPHGWDADDFFFTVSKSQDPNQSSNSTGFHYQVWVTHKSTSESYPVGRSYYQEKGDYWETPLGEGRIEGTREDMVQYGGGTDFLLDLKLGVETFIRLFGKQIKKP